MQSFVYINSLFIIWMLISVVFAVIDLVKNVNSVLCVNGIVHISKDIHIISLEYKYIQMMSTEGRAFSFRSRRCYFVTLH